MERLSARETFSSISNTSVPGLIENCWVLISRRNREYVSVESGCERERERIKTRCIYKTSSLRIVPSTVCHLSPLGISHLSWQCHIQSNSEMVSLMLSTNPSTEHMPYFGSSGQPLRGDRGTTPSFTMILICSVEAREGSAQDSTVYGKWR